MTSSVWMGLLALAILWLNTVLVALDAVERRRWLGRNRWLPSWTKPRAGDGFVRVQVIAGEGAEGTFAQHSVDQRGRRIDSRAPCVAFHDQGHESEVCGGRVRADSLTVDVPAAERSEVWPDAASLRARADAPLEPEPWARAEKGKGYARQLRTLIKAGDSVWLGGHWMEADGGWMVAPPPGRPLLVSQTDPVAWIARARAELALFSAAVIAAAAGVTALALTPPVFGPVSTVGGAVGLVFFLLVQPAGTWMRGRTIEPAYAEVRGLAGPSRSSPR